MRRGSRHTARWSAFHRRNAIASEPSVTLKKLPEVVAVARTHFVEPHGEPKEPHFCSIQHIRVPVADSQPVAVGMFACCD